MIGKDGSGDAGSSKRQPSVAGGFESSPAGTLSALGPPCAAATASTSRHPAPTGAPAAGMCERVCGGLRGFMCVCEREKVSVCVLCVFQACLLTWVDVYVGAGSRHIAGLESHSAHCARVDPDLGCLL